MDFDPFVGTNRVGQTGHDTCSSLVYSAASHSLSKVILKTVNISEMALAPCLILIFVSLSSQQFYQEQFFGQVGPNNDPYAQLYSKYQTLLTRVEKLEQQVAGLQQAAHKDWNSTENGAMFKLFEERKNWDQAENYCRSLNAHLAVIDNKEKNEFIKSLITENPTSDFVWIGMKTKATTRGFTDSFSNFNEDSPIDGCAVMDTNGIWSIRSCTQLRPFVCQMVITPIN